MNDSSAQLEQQREQFLLDPVSHYVRLGQLLLQVGNASEAVSVGLHGLQLVPGDIEGLLLLGTALAHLHRWEESQEQLLAVVKVDRNSAWGFRLLGEVLLRRQDYVRAVPVLEQARTLNPDDPSIPVFLQHAYGQRPLPILPALEPIPIRELVEGEAASPASQPTVRPRLISAEKPKDAAQESLRQSAAAGDAYLGRLLQGGLLDVPSVRVSPSTYQARAEKQWGKSNTPRLMIFLVCLSLISMGGVTWGWYTKKKAVGVATKYIAKASGLVESGAGVDMMKAEEDVSMAIALDSSDSFSLLVRAEIFAVSGFLHGSHSADEVEEAFRDLPFELEVEAKGYRELLIARTAKTLMGFIDQGLGTHADLKATIEELIAALDYTPDDHFLDWLLGRAYSISGQLELSGQHFAMASADGEGPAIAIVDYANYLLDLGDFDKAIVQFDIALKKSPKHELAFVGRSLARSEQRTGLIESMSDISIGLVQVHGKRLKAWKELATAYVQLALEDYDSFSEALGKAEGPKESRFLARVGLARVYEGKLAAARSLRDSLQWYGTNPEDYPLVVLLDAELLFSQGLSEKVLTTISEWKGVIAQRLQAKALFVLGRVEEASRIFERELQRAPDDIEIQVWANSARMISMTGVDQQHADDTLNRLGRKSKNNASRYVHGLALISSGKLSIAMEKLEQSVTNLTKSYPNPLAYRSYFTLAQVAFARGKLEKATEYLDQSMLYNATYIPAIDLQGQMLLEFEPEEALKKLQIAVLAEISTIGGDLAYARALAATDGDLSDMRQAIVRAKDKGAELEKLQEIIEEIDETLFKELDVERP